MKTKLAISLLVLGLLSVTTANADSSKEREEADLQKYFEKQERLKNNKRGKIEKIGNRLKKILDSEPGEYGYKSEEEVIDITIALDSSDIAIDDSKDEDVVLEAAIADGEVKYMLRNGKKITKEALEKKLKEKRDLKKSRRAAKKENVNKKLKKFAKKNSLEKHKDYLRALERGEDTFSLKLKKSEVRDLIENNRDDIVGIELTPRIVSSINGALIATNIANSINPVTYTDPAASGNNIGIFISEYGGCPYGNGLGNYTNLFQGIASSDHAEAVVEIVRKASPDAHIYCRWLPTYYSDLFLESFGDTKVYVQNVSWSMWDDGNENERCYRTRDRYWDDATYSDDVLAVSAAGNYDQGKYVGSPAKALNVLTVGNYEGL